MNRRKIGNIGEDAACSYLKKRGYVILERNFSRRCGEIDIIARKKDAVVFVEVKCRSTERFGAPAEAVNFTKQGRIVKTAALYMQENDLMDVNVRFDIIEVLSGELRHIQAAFDATQFL